MIAAIFIIFLLIGISIYILTYKKTVSKFDSVNESSDSSDSVNESSDSVNAYVDADDAVDESLDADEGSDDESSDSDEGSEEFESITDSIDMNMLISPEVERMILLQNEQFMKRIQRPLSMTSNPNLINF